MRVSLAQPVSSSTATISIVIEAARCWRAARDARRLVLPALYARLEPRGFGMLAPVVDGLLAMFEAGFRRPFRAGEAPHRGLSGDEQQLLDLLADDRGAVMDQVVPNLTSAMRAALRSARIVLRAALGREVDTQPAGFAPIFFVEAAEAEPEVYIPVQPHLEPL